MAATVAVNKNGVLGDIKYALVSVTGDASYPTGGYPLDVNQVGCPLTRLAVFQNEGNAGGAAVFAAIWNDATKKVQFYATQGVEVTAAVNVSAYTFQFLFLGY